MMQAWLQALAATTVFVDAKAWGGVAARCAWQAVACSQSISEFGLAPMAA